MLDILPMCVSLESMTLLAALGPLSVVQILLGVAVVALVASGIAWWLQQRKLETLEAAAELTRVDLQSRLNDHQAESSRKITETQKKLADEHAVRTSVEERFSAFQDSSQRRENDSLARITALEADLAASRESIAQLTPAQARIGDLEALLSAERGRLRALEQALAVTHTRGQDLTRQLQDAQTHFTTQQERVRAREAELMRLLAEREQILASDQARLGNVDKEISRLKETAASYQTTAEGRITSLQRQLAAAEAKAAMVQKEFMSAVGVLPEPSVAGAVAPNDKRVTDLEAKISQIEAEARKKAREDGYKIAELEYRLAEASEAAAKVQEVNTKSAEVETLRAQVSNLMAEKDYLAEELETAKLIKANAVSPMPELREQGLLPMEAPPLRE